MDSLAGNLDSAPQRPSQPRFEVADVLRRYGDDYCASHTLSPQQAKALRAIELCRTEALGGHLDRCDHCGHEAISYNACRNRKCPKCRGSQRAAWVEARELELLPVQYFHVVFTLPEALLGLSGYHPVALPGLLFQSAAETLQTFAANRWDAELGIVMVLHTWGQTLNAHPHVHCIVTGGALKRDGSAFVPAPKNFLFPVRGLSRVFRGNHDAGGAGMHSPLPEPCRAAAVPAHPLRRPARQRPAHSGARHLP